MLEIIIFSKAKKISMMKQDEPSSQFVYDVFISYSTDPDYQLSRKIDRFLESFHKIKTDNDVKLKPLSVCRDGSDFNLHSLKKQASKSSQSDDSLKNVLVHYLQQSEYLLVLCSGNTALSEYVRFEIDWFIQNKGVDFILLAVTEGSNIKEEEAKIFSEKIIQQKLQTKIFYDLRGFKKESKKWKKVRDHEEELTNVAAFLNHETSGRILPLWRKEERKKLKKQRYIGVVAALIFLGFAIIAFFLRENAIRNEKVAVENLRKYKKEQFQRNMRNGLVYFNAKEYLFARKEFLAAESVITQYPDDSLLAGQKDTVSILLQKCVIK
jgi:hypothetical protein